MAAQARSSGSSFLPNSPRALSMPSSSLTPPSPQSVPNASKNAIFSVRSASLASLPLMAASIFGQRRAMRARRDRARGRDPDVAMRVVDGPLEKLQRAGRRDLA